jgi:hypothetical protein
MSRIMAVRRLLNFRNAFNVAAASAKMFAVECSLYFAQFPATKNKTPPVLAAGFLSGVTPEFCYGISPVFLSFNFEAAVPF